MMWVMWNLTSFSLEIVLVWCRIGARFAPNVPSASKSFGMHPMVLLADEAQVKALFGPFANSDNLDARLVHSLRGMYHRLRNHFGRTRWNS